jgi:CheY-like chemotaxis protein
MSVGDRNASTDTDRVKCLVVDDREENVLALSALLRAPDVEVLEASCGTDALELLLAHDVALALLDVQMPNMDGFELAELIRGSARTRTCR